MTEQTSEFLRSCLRAKHDRIEELTEETISLKRSNFWLAFAGLTGWGAVITICVLDAIK